jgi:hypothetical protein
LPVEEAARPARLQAAAKPQAASNAEHTYSFSYQRSHCRLKRLHGWLDCKQRPKRMQQAMQNIQTVLGTSAAIAG